MANEASVERAPTFWTLPDRLQTTALAAILGVVFIAFLSMALDGRIARLILDKGSTNFPYPFTIQNLMHLFFFVALGDLFVRWRVATRETAFLHRQFLPEDDATVLQAHDLSPIRRRVAQEFDAEHGFLPGLIDLSILQFQSSRSVDQTVAVMNSSLELLAHRVNMRYNTIRFIAWFVPTLGFIGTVFSLGAALYNAGQQETFNMQQTATTLGIGFDTTMVALVESAILVFLIHVVEEREETAVNRAGSYTLRNLINRLYEGR